MMLVIVLGMAAPAVMGQHEAITAAETQRQNLDEIQIKTSMSITNLQAPAQNTTMSFTLENTGSTKLWNYQKFTVLVQYNGQVAPLVSQPETEQLVYRGLGTSPPAGAWSIGQFINDHVDPQIVNPGESAVLYCHLSTPLYTSGNVTVVVATDSGAQTTGSGVIS